MSEIKMSDVFNLPLPPAGLFHRLDTLKCRGKNKYIAEAINNHDRLVAENKALKEALQRIADWNECNVEFRVNFGSNGERDYYRKIAMEKLK